MFTIENSHRWNGRKDPYLYTASARLESGDEIRTDFGIRRIAFDGEERQYKTALLLRLGRAYQARGWAMQLHFGVMQDMSISAGFSARWWETGWKTENIPTRKRPSPC